MGERDDAAESPNDESEPEALVGENLAADAEPARELRGGSIARYDPLQAYLNEVQRHALLTPQEEHDLAVRFAEKGDVEAAARLVTANLRLVVKLAFEYRRAHRNVLDLIQEGNIGLMKAVQKFDPYRGVKLSTYSAWWIRAYILRYVLANWRLVKVGTTQAQRKLFFNLAKEKARLAAQGIAATAEGIGERLGVDAAVVEEMERRLEAPEASLDAPRSSEEGRTSTRLDLLAGLEIRADDEMAQAQLRRTLNEKLGAFHETLEGREKFIFEQRLLTDAPLTLQEIGEKYGVSRERARQVEKRLTGRLRAYLIDQMGDHLPFEAEGEASG